MTTSIERFAEIIWNAQHPLVPDLTWDEISTPGKWIDVQEALDAARAAILALPTADVDRDGLVADHTERRIYRALPGGAAVDESQYLYSICEECSDEEVLVDADDNCLDDSHWGIVQWPCLVFRLADTLDAQAAAHAAELDWKVGAAEARERAAVVEVEALRAEKASMTEAYQAASASLAKANVAIANMDDNFDTQEAAYEQALAEVRADRDAYRARIDAVRALIEEPFTASDIRAALDGDA